VASFLITLDISCIHFVVITIPVLFSLMTCHRVCNQSIISGTETAHPSVVPEFSGVRVAHFSVFCVLLYLFVLLLLVIALSVLQTASFDYHFDIFNMFLH
jgi:hypothetical protein